MKDDKTKVTKVNQKKPAKVEKKISAKKLPALFRKAYSEKEFEKKILKKLYVEEDVKLIKSLFSEKIKIKDETKLAVSMAKEFTKKEFNALKEIAKNIKANKGRIKLLPLAACGIVLTVLIVLGSIFKNQIAEYLIVSGCQSVFGAKTEIEDVDVDMLGITIHIKGIAIGDKNSEGGMKNLFEAGTMVLDVSLADACRGKFICEEISVNDMKWGTSRTTSCLLPEEEKVEEEEEESEFAKEMKARSAQAVADVKVKLEEYLGVSLENPKDIPQEYFNKLQTPKLTEEVKSTSTEVVEKWKARPDEIKEQVSTLTESVKDLKSINASSFKTPEGIVESLKKIEVALDEIESAKKTINNTQKEIKVDMQDLQLLAQKIQTAFNSDLNLAKSLKTKLTDKEQIKDLLIEMGEIVGYDMLQEYYPYAKQALDIALMMKEEAEKHPKEKKETYKRLEGRTLWFGSEKPGLWIGKIAASGPNFEGHITDISNNQDYKNKPTVAHVAFTVKDKYSHSGDFVIDARSDAKQKEAREKGEKVYSLIHTNYYGDGFGVSFNKELNKGQYVPSVEGVLGFGLAGDFDKGYVDVEAGLNLRKLEAEAPELSNEILRTFYLTALKSVVDQAKANKAGLEVEFGIKYANGKLSPHIKDNIINIFEKALAAGAKKIAADAAAKLAKQIEAKIAEYKVQAETAINEKLKEFNLIDTDIKLSADSLEDVKKQLVAKQKELLKVQTEKFAGKVNDKIESTLTKKLGIKTPAKEENKQDVSSTEESGSTVEKTEEKTSSKTDAKSAAAKALKKLF